MNQEALLGSWPLVFGSLSLASGFSSFGIHRL
jgi:hypothetical protein